MRILSPSFLPQPTPLTTAAAAPLLPFSLIFLFVTTAVAQTTIVVPPSGNLQASLDSATWGDVIKLQAGGVYETPVPYQFKPKGTPPTGTLADCITLTTDDPSGTPQALMGYPATQTRITTAMAAKMPKVRTRSSLPVFDFAKGSRCVIVERLEISAVDTGVQVIRLISGDIAEQIKSYSELPDTIVIRYNWIHPPQETGQPLSSANIARSVENTMYLGANNVQVYNNAMQGFVGRFKYGGEAGARMTSSNILLAVGENWRVENNLLEAWTYAFFAGGGRMPSWTVTGGGTVSSCVGNPTTQCDFSNTTGLAVGDPVSIFVSTSSSQNKWGASFVKSISENTVVFTKPLCQSFDGSNSCTNQNGTPANGDRVQWNGKQPTNFLFQRNVFAHYPEWTGLLSDCGGKGYMELKSCVDCVFNGNVFKGCSGMTITVRNQAGDFPWASLDGLTFTNNYFENSNNTFVGFFQDVIPTKRSKNIHWHNNLMVGVQATLNSFFPGGYMSGNMSNGDNVSITHNTVVWNPMYRNFTNFGVMNGLKVKDNIFGMGQNACFNNQGNTHPMINCWPNADITNNVIVNTGTNDYVKEWWLGNWPNQSVPTSWAQVGFVNAPTALDGSGDYRLRADSPYKGKASDGTDPGVNYTELVDALGFDPAGRPVPSPPPSPSPTPTPSLGHLPLPGDTTASQHKA